MSDCSASLSDTQEVTQTQKRKASQAGLDGNGNGRSVKRRASKACQCCRARKVRCNVTEHGAPCTNCRLDEVECIVSESRRKKKWSKDDENTHNEVSAATATLNSRKLASRDALDGMTNLSGSGSGSRRSHDAEPRLEEHVPHSIYQTHSTRLNYTFQEMNRRANASGQTSHIPMLGYSPLSTDFRQPYLANIAPKHTPAAPLPLFIKPLPSRIGPDEVSYLEKKGALSVPNPGLRNELLGAYIEFVHPYMPLLDLHEFVLIVDRADGNLGKISLILFQAVMFAGSAFVDMRHLRTAGYSSRKEARKDFFQKTRLLYDFDYESDRVSLVQALLLLTYYYETPDDQKDTWHWMGVATSVAHTIGLHRNPDKSNMDAKRTKLWKRIWWSTYMRDRLIALGMRRPTRIKTEDYDVPMLSLDDFDFEPLPESVTCIPADCTIARDSNFQRRLAIMCIAKAKLCLCISHVLSKQYCVLNNDQGLASDRTTMMLLPKKLDPETCEVETCDEELKTWLEELPLDAQYTPDSSGNKSIDLHKALLHMVYFTTLSALHRPQVLPSSAPNNSSSPSSNSPGQQSQSSPSVNGNSATPTPSNSSHDLLETSRRNVRRAATAITSIAQTLDSLDLVRYLPTTGVTVLLPAIIIHLLDIKAPDEDTRRTSLRGFCQCMQVMGKLRDLYAAADYSTAFLEAAIRKAGIHIQPFTPAANSNTTTSHSNKPEPVNSVEDLVDAGRRLEHLSTLTGKARTLTPPPDSGMGLADNILGNPCVTDEEVKNRLETYLASTPPESDHHDGSDASHYAPHDHENEREDDDASALFNPDISDITHSGLTGLAFASGISMSNALPYTLNSAGFGNMMSGMMNGMNLNQMGLAEQTFDEGDFDALLNLDGDSGNVGGFTFDVEGTGVAGCQGESSGVMVDVEWMKSIA